MRIIRAKDNEDLSRKAATMLGAQVTLKPQSVLGLATGSTPIDTYQQLIAMCENGSVDFSEASTINLDEYVGLKPEDDQSYRYFMNDNLFNHINIKKENTHVPNGMAPDTQKECARYDALIEQKGGIDMQLLGIGHNGHIGFNEPNTAFVPDTNCVTLTESTLEANSRFFIGRDDMPTRALTTGIRAIMQAKSILVIVLGAGKAEIVKQAFTGPVTPMVPASVLQLHPNVTLIGDKEALSLL